MEPQQIFTVFNIIRIFLVGTLAFFVNLVVTHFWTRVLYKYFRPGKEIEKTDAPIFNALHRKKEGTPTMGGLPIWVTVSSLTLLFWLFSYFFDDVWRGICA